MHCVRGEHPGGCGAEAVAEEREADGGQVGPHEDGRQPEEGGGLGGPLHLRGSQSVSHGLVVGVGVGSGLSTWEEPEPLLLPEPLEAYWPEEAEEAVLIVDRFEVRRPFQPPQPRRPPRPSRGAPAESPRTSTAHTSTAAACITSGGDSGGEGGGGVVVGGEGGGLSAGEGGGLVLGEGGMDRLEMRTWIESVSRLEMRGV